MTIKLGVSPSSWGIWFADDPQQMPWPRFLDQVVTAGYAWIELGPFGYLPTDSASLRRELAARGLQLSAGFLRGDLADREGRDELIEQGRMLAALLRSCGAAYVVLMDAMYQDLHTGAQTRRPRLTPDEWKILLETVHHLAEMVRQEFGLGLLVEPHTASRIEYCDQIETLLADTDPARVSLLLDVGHFAWRNGDPSPFMREHHARIPYIHLKSIDAQVQKRVLDENASFPDAVRMGIFCEPALGALDMDSLYRTLRAVNFDGWAIVEQGMYPAPFDKPLPIAKRTRDYLQDKGWE